MSDYEWGPSEQLYRTSEEISSAGSDQLGESSNESIWLRAIAYQLAAMNEREAAKLPPLANPLIKRMCCPNCAIPLEIVNGTAGMIVPCFNCKKGFTLE